jgi:hypothetical protein
MPHEAQRQPALLCTIWVLHTTRHHTSCRVQTGRGALPARTVTRVQTEHSASRQRREVCNYEAAKQPQNHTHFPRTLVETCTCWYMFDFLDLFSRPPNLVSRRVLEQPANQLVQASILNASTAGGERSGNKGGAPPSPLHTTHPHHQDAEPIAADTTCRCCQQQLVYRGAF